jgi:putative glutamine amidotransferase
MAEGGNPVDRTAGAPAPGADARPRRDERPLIGMTLMLDVARHGEHVPRYSMNRTFFTSIRRAGGIPVPLVPGDPAEMARFLGPPDEEGTGALDGLCLTAGGDLAPHYFGQPRKPGCEDPDVERDAMEIELLALTRRSALPLLALCRGMQVLNAAWGGSIIQDIASERPEALDHSHHEGRPRDTLIHEIRTAPGSLVQRILETESRPVNSLHHQAIDEPAPGLRPTAWAPDGIVEALELAPAPPGPSPADRFLLGVQFHPEDLPEDAGMQRIFRAFVDAAYAYRTARR